MKRRCSQSSLLGAAVRLAAERAVVVVHAAYHNPQSLMRGGGGGDVARCLRRTAVQLDGLAVEDEAGARVKREAADAEGGGLRVRAAVSQAAAAREGRDCSVE